MTRLYTNDSIDDDVIEEIRHYLNCLQDDVDAILDTDISGDLRSFTFDTDRDVTFRGPNKDPHIGPERITFEFRTSDGTRWELTKETM